MIVEKIKDKVSTLQNRRKAKKQSKPWSKKQKIIFLAFFGAVIIYIVASMMTDNYSMPSLNLSVSGLDIALICLLGIGFAIFKLRTYIKRRKGNGK